jgi:predicted DNA-binding WGR domain protein
LSLDAVVWLGDNRGMSSDPILFWRIDPSRNMARYYEIAAHDDLFGATCLVRRWGRIGTLGKTRIEVFADRSAAARAMERLAAAKRRKGYRPA